MTGVMFSPPLPRQQRSLDQQLRQQQEEEFQKSLMADREKVHVYVYYVHVCTHKNMIIGIQYMYMYASL